MLSNRKALFFMIIFIHLFARFDLQIDVRERRRAPKARRVLEARNAQMEGYTFDKHTLVHSGANGSIAGN